MPLSPDVRKAIIEGGGEIDKKGNLKRLPDALCIDSNGFLCLRSEVKAEGRKTFLEFIITLLTMIFGFLAMGLSLFSISFTLAIVFAVLTIIFLYLPDFLGWA